MERDDNPLERNLADALRRLNAAALVPPVDAAREAALLAAFDAAQASRAPGRRRDLWYLGVFAAAAVVLIAVGITPVSTGRHGPLPGGPAGDRAGLPSTRGVLSEPPNDFVIVPGAAALPPMESGTLIRLDLPASVLASYGVTPPPGRTAHITTDLVVGQDGLPRAVRIVN